MLGFLRRLRRARPPAPPAPAALPVPEGTDWPAPRPDAPVYVIGDVHGRLDRFERLLARIADDAGALGIEPRCVLVGDYVDRGPDAAGVLRAARILAPDGGGPHAALRGNHEEMLLSFLDDPAGRGLRWLRFGGDATLASFGIAPPDPDGDLSAAQEASEALAEALGPLAAWLRALPATWRSGDLAVTHAGADPALPLEAQEASALVWGHPDFLTAERADGLWVAHGHVVTERAYASGGRIGVDTGAVFGGPLTAARILPGAAPEFLSVS